MSPYLVQNDWPVCKSKAVFEAFHLQTCLAPINFSVLRQSHFDGIQRPISTDQHHTCLPPLPVHCIPVQALCAVDREGRAAHACWWQGWRRCLMTLRLPWCGIELRKDSLKVDLVLQVVRRWLSASVMSSTLRHVGLVVIQYMTKLFARRSLVSS